MKKITKRLCVLATAALLCACGTPRDAAPPSGAAAAPERVATVSAPAAPRTAATSEAPAARAAKVSMASTPKAYRVDGAKHLYAVYADRIFKGKLPPLMHAVVVTEVELDAAGNVREIQMVRVPSHAPEVVVKVREMIRAASPLPAPQRMGGTRYTDVWLVDKSGRFQLDTLTEGQL
jgi:periplasmic protein TonB